ncbi:MAG: SGNH/GDSL hydrolase family protein [Clostridium sp.]|nr:SGNH/GDSL hydrolase family protein [Acetatifactor muris]MCM1525915.1 SGNH/GDSL hydrolase family protein [Bacteroides sp.]MCM1562546.1 SGNH/GDSL hydrolase family protein [Clostridium sp.]
MRDNGTEKQKIAYALSALAVFAVLCVPLFGGRTKAQGADHPIVILGDSVMGLCRDETSVSENLSDILRQPVYNGAFGGTCLSTLTQNIWNDYTMGLLNMVSLSKGIAAGDLGAQQTLRGRRESTYYFGDTVDGLDEIDFAETEVLIFEFGLNDYHAGVPIDNPDDPLDERTYCGAFRSAVRTLQGARPNLRIVYATPTYAWYPAGGLTCEEYETGQAFLEEYVNAGLAVAEECGIEAVDLYHDLYPHDNFEDWQIYTEDGLHPNAAGRRLIAERLAALFED